MARQPSPGTCYLCEGTFPKGSMTRHLTKCLEAHDTAESAGAGKTTRGKLIRVVVEGNYDPIYWLYLEMPASTKLQFLDQFLRDIWLECCDHLSAFRIEGKKRLVAPQSVAEMLAGISDWKDPNEVDMDSRVSSVFKKETKVSYDYDFGSTTTLSLKGVGGREGIIVNPNDVRLLARNDPPFIPCGNCEKAAATLIDMEDSNSESGWLCDKCAKKAGLADREMTLPVVNSPRTGVCAYSGN